MRVTFGRHRRGSAPMLIGSIDFRDFFIQVFWLMLRGGWGYSSPYERAARGDSGMVPPLCLRGRRPLAWQAVGCFSSMLGNGGMDLGLDRQARAYVARQPCGPAYRAGQMSWLPNPWFLMPRTQNSRPTHPPEANLIFCRLGASSARIPKRSVFGVLRDEWKREITIDNTKSKQ